jgi:L-fucose dehydrogenase
LDLQLKAKVVLIAGAANGIGEAIIRAVAAEGAIPVIIDRDQEAANQLQKKLPGSELATIELSHPQECAAAIEQTVRKLGRIDGLVNNAGVDDSVGLAWDNPEAYAESLGRTLIQYYAMAHYGVPHLKRTQGSIVNISSTTAAAGQGSALGYASAKGAILALTREWAAELLPYGIRVNAIVPAEVDTSIHRDAALSQGAKVRETTLRNFSREKRMMTPEEIASTVVFLLSARASHVTGQHLSIQGANVHLNRALI